MSGHVEAAVAAGAARARLVPVPVLELEGVTRQYPGSPPVRALDQASLAVANLATALAESGATLADVLKTTVFVASAERSDLVAAWDVVSAAFGEHDAPSTLLGVAVLGYAGQLVEIEAVAVAPG